MQRVKVLFLLGLWIAVLPYFGIPFFWKNILFTISGLFLTIIAYLMYRETKRYERNLFDNFRENNWTEDKDELEKTRKE